MALIHGYFKNQNGESSIKELSVDSQGKLQVTGIAERVSQGGYQAVPANNANGTELSNRPATTTGVRLELATGATITYFFALKGTVTSSAPDFTKTLSIAGTTDEPLSGDDSLFVTAHTGTVIFRWIQQ